MAKIHPRAPYSSHYPPHPHHHHHHASSSGTESAHWACRIWGDDPGHIPDIGLLNLGEGSGERRSSGGGGGLRWEEEREEKQIQKSLEEASPSTTTEPAPTGCLPQPRGKDTLTQKTYTHICKLQYKRAANLMIRDYYLKGPTVTDLFVISCNNTDGNEFICINVSVTRTSVEILH